MSYIIISLNLSSADIDSATPHNISLKFYFFKCVKSILSFTEYSLFWGCSASYFFEIAKAFLICGQFINPSSTKTHRFVIPFIANFGYHCSRITKCFR